MVNQIDKDDHSLPAHDALDPLKRGPNSPNRRMEKIADDMARRSTDRIKRNEVGKGVVPESDGH